MTRKKSMRLVVGLLLVLFTAQIFAPLAVTYAQSEGNETAMDGNGNLTLSANVSENATVKATGEESEKNRITFVLGTDENRASLENASTNATVNSTVNVTIYNASEAEAGNFSNESVVFLASLGNETVASINQTINESAYVFAYNLSSNISIGNVEDVNITKYWVYGGDENIVNLILYMNNTFYGGNTPVNPPKPPQDRAKIAFVMGGMPEYLLHINRVTENPYISKSINVTAYSVYSYEPASYENLNLSDHDVIMLAHLPYPAADAIKETVGEARDNEAYVITYMFADVHNLSNVNISDPAYSNITKYWDYGGEENMKRLIIFLGVKFCNVSMEILPPVPTPLYGLYHPDAPRVFKKTSEYLEWYNSSGKYNVSNYTVGIHYYYASGKSGTYPVINALIRSLESKGANAIFATYTYRDQNSSKYFIQDNSSIVDALIVLHCGRLYSYEEEKGIEYLKNLNVTSLKGIMSLYYSPEEWENSSIGLKPGDIVWNIVYSELDGLTEFIIISGKTTDPVSSLKYYEPINYQIDWIMDRAISWAKLHRMNNSEKKIAITYYSEGGGKANLGADIDYYLDVQSSLKNLLDAMKEREYNLGNGSSPNKTELAELMVQNGSNFGTWAQGELDKRVKNGSVILIPESEYLEWFKELPVDKQDEVIERWGTPPGEIMVYKNETGKYLVIPKIQFGNVLLLPHPTWGFLQNDTTLYYDGAIPPHHQYIAFYFWLNKEFMADAIFTPFTQLSLMPGKQVGLSRHDWVGTLLQNMPHVHPFPIQGNGALNNKRRANAVIVDYMVTIVPSGLYGNLSDLQRKISLYDQAKGALKEEYRKEIIEECRDLNLDQDLEINLNSTINNTTAFDGFIKRLNNYLNQIKREYMPYGSHTLGEPPTNDSLVEMVESMLGEEFKERVSKINASEGVTTMLLTEVLLNSLSPEDAQNTVLGQISNNITEDLNISIEYANRIDACKIEIPRILDALEGKYILPGPMDDPIRNPDALPTGRNPYTFDPRIIPTKAAWNVGKTMTDQLLEQHLNKTGEYPQKVAFVLWSSETTKHHGIMESEILYLLGVKPVWDSKGRVKDVKLINSSELGRSRIDVVVITSGLYRNHFQSKIVLIDKAVRLAAQSNDTEYTNYVKENSEAIKRKLLELDYNESVASGLSMMRIFSEAEGAYSPNLQFAIPASDTWEGTEKLAELYINRMSYAYGENIWGEHLTELFKQNLKGVEVSVFSRSSNVYGVLDHPMVAAYFGGLNLAVKSVSGNAPDMYINNLREPNNPKVETLHQFLNRELRARYFNPKWIEGMMEHGYDGTRYMAQFTEDLWMWDVVTPDLITTDMWNQVYDVYIQDKYNRGLKDFFGSNNPYAQQSMTARMLEAIRKGYWSPSEDVKTALAETYQKSVEEYGVTCCHHTCANLLLQDYMQGILSVPGEQSKEAYHRHGGGGARRITEEETGEGLTNMTEMVGVSKEGEELKKPPEKTAEEKKGKVMKEEKPVEKPSPAFPISGAPLMGILAVIVVLVLIGIGLGLKRRKM